MNYELKERFDEIYNEVIKEYIKERTTFNYGYIEKLLRDHSELTDFKINENVFDKNPQYYRDLHIATRLITQFNMEMVFKGMKIDLNDPNVKEDKNEGNIGTPGRLAKMWCGADLHDDRELLSGRFAVPVRLAKFPDGAKSDIPIFKKVDLTAVCSHHLAPFSTKFSENSKVVIGYIPDEYVLGISKLQRVVRNIAQRGWLQEDLTKAIYDEISKAAETKNVYVRIENMKHSCEFLRGALSESDGFTSEYYGGKFKKKKYLENARNQ